MTDTTYNPAQRHSAGPWRVGADEDGEKVVECDDGILCRLYAYASPDYEEALPGDPFAANAQLMALAPEMLAVVGNLALYPELDHPFFHSLILQARAVLANLDTEGAK